MRKVPSYNGPRLPSHTPKRAPRTTTHGERRLYDLACWKKTRAIKLSEQPLCEWCWRDGRGPVEATECHHQIKVVDRPDLALDLGNLVALCKPCHDGIRGGG